MTTAVGLTSRPKVTQASTTKEKLIVLYKPQSRHA